MFLKHISQARCPLWGRDSGKRNSQPGTVPTAGTRLRKEKQSTRHSAHCGDKTQERETVNQAWCPLQRRGSEKRNNQPDTVPTAGTRLREEAPSSATYGAHCCDETHEEGAIQKAVKHHFLSERAWASRLAQKVRHSLAESQFDLVARVVCGLRDSGPNWP